ncbi:hypothetical protein RSAG8_13912, partial [Rhizoctonia solani AG-8 WAC10335]
MDRHKRQLHGSHGCKEIGLCKLYKALKAADGQRFTCQYVNG